MATEQEEMARFVEAQRVLWARAVRIAERHPDLDVHGLYRTLKNLERTPEERLRLGLRAGRLRRNG